MAAQRVSFFFAAKDIFGKQTMNTHLMKFLINSLIINSLISSFTAVNCDLLLVDNVTIDSSRVVQSYVNPKCPEGLCDNLTVIYTTSDNSTTCDHHFWSLMPNESPSFMIVETAGTAASNSSGDARINWKKLLSNDPSGSVGLEDIYQAIGLSVNRIFFWDDPTSDGAFNETSDQIMIKDFSTALTNVSHTHVHDNSSSYATFTFGELGTNLTVKLRISTQSNGGRTEQLPQLKFNDRSLNFEVVVNGTSSVDYQKNRLGIEFTLVHAGKEFKPKSTASIDDEFSPGVFAVSINKQSM